MHIAKTALLTAAAGAAVFGAANGASAQGILGGEGEQSNTCSITSGALPLGTVAETEANCLNFAQIFGGGPASQENACTAATPTLSNLANVTLLHIPAPESTTDCANLAVDSRFFEN